MFPRLSRHLGFVAGALVLAALVASLTWALVTLPMRPLDGVEGDVLFEADRIRAGLPLYVDPRVGSDAYGEPPARFLVLYPPLWSWALSLVPKGAAAIAARSVATGAWLFVLAFAALRAPERRRRAAIVLAMLAASVWVLMLYGASGRPDSVAVLLAGLALARAARRGDVDAVSGALFALAAFVKPNVVGMAPGALIAAAVATRRLRGIASAAITAVAVGLALTATTGGRWVSHLLASTAQPPNGALFLEQIVDRLPFFVLPIGFALACGWRARSDPRARIVTAALATSSAWSLVCLAKIGSASNYFLEPMVAAVVVMSAVDLPEPTARNRAVLAVLLLAQAAWIAPASVRGAVSGIARAREQAEAIAAVRSVCGAGPDDVVLADEPGLELALDGRVVDTPFQSTHLAYRDRFAVSSWIRDVRRPEVACLVMQDDLLERPLDEIDVVHDRYGTAMRRALRERFRLVAERGGYRIYRASDRNLRP